MLTTIGMIVAIIILSALCRSTSMKYLLVLLVFLLAGFLYYRGTRPTTEYMILNASPATESIGSESSPETTPCHTWDSQGNCVHGHVLVCPRNWTCLPYPYDHTKYGTEWGDLRHPKLTAFQQEDNIIGAILFLYGPLAVVTLFFLIVFIAIILILIKGARWLLT